MKWELIAAVGPDPIFESGTLRVGPTDPADVLRQLARWVAAGRLIRLRRGRVTPLGAFVYRHVRAAMFWGFETHTLEGGGQAYAAAPEKALNDLLYLTTDSEDPRYLDELRLQHLERLRLPVLSTMAGRTGSPRVAAAVRHVIGLAQPEG